MDTLTHALSGALLARLIHTRPAAASVSAPGRPVLWQVVTVGAVAGAFPDVDVVARWWGDVAYLLHHRGITHSLLLAPAWAALVAWLMAWGFATTRGQPGAWRRFYVVALGGVLIHVAGDWITQFGTMLLAPWSNTRYGLGSVFIIDLVVSGTLVAGLLVAAWLPRRRWPAALGLGLTVAWVGVTWVGQQEAREVGLARAQALGWTDATVVVMPRPASPFNWTVAVQRAGQYELAHVNTRRTQPLRAPPDAGFLTRLSAPYLPVAQARWQALPQWGDAGDAAWVRAAWARPEFAFYRWFAEVPALTHAEVRRVADGSVQRCAWFRDLRFGFPGREAAPFQYGICLKGDDVARAAAQVFRLAAGIREPVALP